MVSTRAMARQAPSKEDKENDSQLSLRKKPVRRAKGVAVGGAAAVAPPPPTETAKPATTARPTRKRPMTPIEPPPAAKASPLSPKKITQVAKAPVVEAQPEKKTTRSRKPPVPSAVVTTTRRPTRATPAVVPAPKAPAKPLSPKPRATRRKAALPAAARGKAAKTQKAKPEPEPQPEPELESEAEEQAIEPEQAEETAQETHAAEPELEHDEDEEHEVQPADVVKEQNDETQDEEDDTHDTAIHNPPQDEEADEEVDQDVEPAQSTPKMRVTRSHGVQQEEEEEEEDADTEEEEEDGANDSSDDEICGPKTPMRRGVTPAKGAFSVNARRLQTPARDFLGHRNNKGTPQTQRVPTKAAAVSSPQRPMTVSRAADKAMVFRPLKQKSPENVTSSEEHHDEESQEHPVDLDVVAESDVDELDQSEAVDVTMTMAMPSPARKLDFEPEEAESEDELAGNGHATDSSDDEEVEDTIVEEEDAKESDFEDVQAGDEVSEVSINSIDDSEMDDSIMPAPQLHMDIESAPSSPASETIEAPHFEVDDSELLSSPAPSTPASVIRHTLDTEATPTDEIAPVARLSISDSDLLSLVDEEENATPNPKSRMSLTAKMMQTPRMEFALGCADAMHVDESPSVTVTEPVPADEGTVTINPSLLTVDEDGVELAFKLENAAAIPTPFFNTPARQRLSMGMSQERMSMLQEDIFNFVNFDVESPEKINRRVSVAASIRNDNELATPRPASRRHTQSQASTAMVQLNQTPKDRRMSHIPPTPPSYARSTFAYDARRKSLPVFNVYTPDNTSIRPHTADTAIKPATSDSFAKLWTSMQSKPASHGSTLIAASSPRLSDMHTPPTPTINKRTSTPSQASVPSVQLQEPETTPASFTGPKPRRHTPSSALKPISRSNTPYESPHTPLKTPLKPACTATPAAYPMTPHPSQPLKSITALVEVFTLDGSSASSPFIALLQRLGARTTKSFSDRVTHVVFKDGSPTTLQKVRLSNKETQKVFCVNSRWVTDCEREGARMDETTDIYTVDVNEIPRGGHRRRKSMEPATLINIDGNVVSGGERSVVRNATSRQSFSRVKVSSRLSTASSFWGEDSPVKATPRAPGRAFGDEDDDEEMADQFFAEPTGGFDVPDMAMETGRMEVGQQTAPVNRVKKLRLRDEDNRRLTFLSGKRD